MSYQVLARKWRPHKFDELVGQEHVVRALTNALEHDRLHHAYLFTGTRGVGKTTIARILAKSLNCEQGVSASPCGVCSACREIDEGRFADLLEVDAASRTKVDQTRELLDNVPYAPVRGRYKVYLIDEVHMFSASSFNALLKTLEEPPPHVKFLLATTDPQKVPVTVLSRCLQFNLKRLPMDQISGQLQRILEQESIEFDQPALRLLSRAADGSMRDALSLMDQAIAFGGGKIADADVQSMLGTISGDQMLTIVGALADGDAAQVLDVVGRMAEQTPDFAGALQGLLTLFHRIALTQVVPDSLGDEVDHLEEIRDFAGRIPAEDVQLFYQIGLIGQRDLPLAPDPRSGFEMVLLRMLAFRPDGTAEAAPSGHGQTARRAPPGKSPAKPSQPAAPARAATRPSAPEPASVAPSSNVPAANPAEAGGAWHDIVGALSLGGMTKQLAAHCVLHEIKAGKVSLTMDPAFKNMKTAMSEKRLLSALKERFGPDTQLHIEVGELKTETPAQLERRAKVDRQREAEEAMAGDELVNALQDSMGGTLVLDSVKPIDPE